MNAWLHTHKCLLWLLFLVASVGGFFGVAVARSPKTLDPVKYENQRDGIVGPCSEYWLGTLQGGHDLAAYLGHAALRSVAIAFAVAATVVTIAFFIGGLWALARNELRFSLLAIAVLTCLGPTPLLMTVAILYCFPDSGSLVALVTAMGLVAWAPFALRLRNEVIRSLDEPFIGEAQREGIRDWRLLWEEVFPLLRPIVESLGILAAIGAMSAEATIGYLAGKSLRYPSLGGLLDHSADAFRYVSAADGVRLLASTGLTITALVLAFRFWGAWREDVRLSRATAVPEPGHRRAKYRGDGFLVSVWLRRLRRELVKDVFVPVLRGRITVIAGGSGSGKSLTVAAIAGQLGPDLRGLCRAMGLASSGHVLLLPQGLQEIFAGNVSIKDYFASANINGEESCELLKKVGLDVSKLRDINGKWKAGRELSGGEAQRVAFCLALELAGRCPPTSRPNVLIVDEGVSALDSDNADRIGKLLRDALVRNSELAVIVVNHRSSWTIRWSDHVAFLGNGRLVWSGPPTELFGAKDPPGATQEIMEYRRAIGLLQRKSSSIASGQPTSIVVSSLSLAYGLRSVARDISFQIDSGEALVITGPSGCGKSSLLKAVTGSGPSLKRSGTISLFGEPSSSLRDDKRRSIRYAVQNPADNLNPAVTVEKIFRRTVKRLQLVNGKKATQELIVEACQKASYPLESLKKTPAELNSGARIRAGLARTFLGKPKLLVLDEPTAGLDPETVVIVLLELRRFLKEGGSILAVMHDIDQIQFLGARTLELAASNLDGN